MYYSISRVDDEGYSECLDFSTSLAEAERMLQDYMYKYPCDMIDIVDMPGNPYGP
jgi:hypothetical protein